MSAPTRYPLFSRSLVDGIAAGIIALGLCLILVSCSEGRTGKQEAPPKDNPNLVSRTVVTEGTGLNKGYIELFTIKHDGHYWTLRNANASSPVHSPMCPCTQRAAP